MNRLAYKSPLSATRSKRAGLTSRPTRPCACVAAKSICCWAPVFASQAQALNPGVVDARARRGSAPAPGERSAAHRRQPGRLGVPAGAEDGLRPEEKRERNVRLLDADELAGQYLPRHGRTQLLSTARTASAWTSAFFVNGIPVLLVETKSATKLEGIAEALDQVRRYHREGPELLAAHSSSTPDPPGSVLLRSHLEPLAQEPVQLEGRAGRSDFETLVKTFVAPQRLVARAVRLHPLHPPGRRARARSSCARTRCEPSSAWCGARLIRKSSAAWSGTRRDRARPTP